jgi:carbonic anhydrase/acetyltransferase-like protein (isoleucine patch superfamily)
MQSETVCRLLFDYESLGEGELQTLALTLPLKLRRWLGTHHPDNRTRVAFFELSGVAIGQDTVINPNFLVSDGYQPLLTIGARVAIGPNVTVICQSGPNNSPLAEVPYVAERLVLDAPVSIEDGAWIGANVVLLPGTTIGRNSVVAAGAVVVHDVEPLSLVGGVPARLLRWLTDEAASETREG